jgi:putative endonuclease
MSNKSKTLYIGVTNNLMRRVLEHKQKRIEGFTQKYNIIKLVYFEWTDSIEAAIRREKQLKNWHRQWKINLIESVNREWADLSLEWFDESDIANLDPETSSG